LSSLKADQEFVEFLREVGSDFSLTQGLGGNSSIKSKDSMLVKASGKRLKEASVHDYFYEVGVSDGQYYEIKSGQLGKPSIEVFLHAMLPHKYVVHLHSTMGVALSILSAEDENLRSALEALGVLIIDYRRPGIDLKEAIKSKLRNQNAGSQNVTFLLRNHGTLFGANSVAKIREEVYRFEKEASLMLKFRPRNLVKPDNLDAVLEQEEARHIRWHAVNNWRISPDHVVFLGVNPPLSLVQDLSERTSIRNILRRVFPDTKQIGPREEQFLWFLNVVQFLPKSPLPTLDEGEAKTLVSWEAEQHRVKSATIEK
jgi:ribulose-5-phosphate 4-epimerase/fuculose-1-phosphate aldolase